MSNTNNSRLFTNFFFYLLTKIPAPVFLVRIATVYGARVSLHREIQNENDISTYKVIMFELHVCVYLAG